MGGQEGGDLVVEDLALNCQQQCLGLGQPQAQALWPVMVLVQHDQIIDRHAADRHRRRPRAGA
jgi:hypothetical protein